MIFRLTLQASVGEADAQAEASRDAFKHILVVITLCSTICRPRVSARTG